MPQGSCLSPLLFNVFVRDLSNVCSTETMQFADDITNSSANKELNVVIENLETSYVEVKDFCTDKGLQVNLKKYNSLSSNKRHAK